MSEVDTPTPEQQRWQDANLQKKLEQLLLKNNNGVEFDFDDTAALEQAVTKYFSPEDLKNHGLKELIATLKVIGIVERTRPLFWEIDELDQSIVDSHMRKVDASFLQIEESIGQDATHIDTDSRDHMQDELALLRDEFRHLYENLSNHTRLLLWAKLETSEVSQLFGDEYQPPELVEFEKEREESAQ